MGVFLPLIKMEDNSLQITLQDNLDLFLGIDWLYQNAINTGPVCSIDIRKKLITDKQSGFRGCPH